MIKNDRLLRALKRTNQGRPPIWLMRQAGRYLPEYRALRSRHSFLEMCHQPELITEVTLLPLRRFAFDAAILFSDILLVAEALGRPFEFVDGKGPVLNRPLQLSADIAQLPIADIAPLSFVAEGIRMLRPQLSVPLIGFCGGPFTVASYLIEGGSSRDLRKTKKWMLRDPTSFHALLQRITDLSIAYLQMQISAGVDLVQIFDSWANHLAFPQFRTFSLFYLHQLVEAVGSQVPVILFCRGSSLFAEALSDLGPSAVGVDWSGDMASVRRRVGSYVGLQGNLDPDLLYAPLPVLKNEVDQMLNSMRGDPAYIFNLGHGVSPDVTVESVQQLVDCVTHYE